jgi:hypothetical protein
MRECEIKSYMQKTNIDAPGGEQSTQLLMLTKCRGMQAGRNIPRKQWLDGVLPEDILR